MIPGRPGCVRLVGVKMKSIRVSNPDVEVRMNVTGVADLDAGVKMKPIKVGMKPIRVWNLNIGVGMNETGVADLNTEVNMPDTLHFDLNAEVKTVDNEVVMKPHGQNLVDGFYF